jgi:UDP-N-acetylmuramate: L-alanyl-gamma-D-glutamyl-meso-diaminopimelate ligase
VKLHLIGICGTGMGAVAELLKAAGHQVRGSDEHVYPPMSLQLAAADIPVMEGFAGANLDWGPEVVVVGNVCRRDHVEVLAATERGMRLQSFPGILEELLLGDNNLVVAGTHGKTTTTSLAAWVLKDAGCDPSYMIGGVPLNTEMGRSAALGKGPFVLEGDEYDTAFFDKKSKFLHYKPRVGILTSVELDHVDIFSGIEAIKQSFREFIALLPATGALYVSATSPLALEVAQEARCRVERYGIAPACGPEIEWRAEVTGIRPGGRTLFEVLHHGKRLGTFETGLPGAYNLENALAVIAALSDPALGLSAEQLARGIRRFVGVRRRQELRGIAQGVSVVDDFAHHPTAVRETLRGLRGRFGSGRLLAVFEPRSATSRTSVFQNEFAEAFAAADEVVVSAVSQPEKTPADRRLDVERLAADIRKHGVPARAIADVAHIVEHLAQRVTAGDTVVVMSSGSFDNLHERLLKRLGDAVMPATAADLSKVRELLLRSKLPTAGVPEDLAELWVLKDTAGEVRGCVAMEVYGDSALLRSLAVHPERRGEGLGWMLAEAVQLRVRQRGLARVCLLTEHATDFFAEKFGFVPVTREQLPDEVKQSSEYRHDQVNRAVAMQLTF